jgi:hypothetical protein
MMRSPRALLLELLGPVRTRVDYITFDRTLASDASRVGAYVYFLRGECVFASDYAIAEDSEIARRVAIAKALRDRNRTDVFDLMLVALRIVTERSAYRNRSRYRRQHYAHRPDGGWSRIALARAVEQQASVTYTDASSAVYALLDIGAFRRRRAAGNGVVPVLVPREVVRRDVAVPRDRCLVGDDRREISRTEDPRNVKIRHLASNASSEPPIQLAG